MLIDTDTLPAGSILRDSLEALADLQRLGRLFAASPDPLNPLDEAATGHREYPFPVLDLLAKSMPGARWSQTRCGGWPILRLS